MRNQKYAGKECGSGSRFTPIFQKRGSAGFPIQNVLGLCGGVAGELPRNSRTAIARRKVQDDEPGSRSLCRTGRRIDRADLGQAYVYATSLLCCPALRRSNTT